MEAVQHDFQRRRRRVSGCRAIRRRRRRIGREPRRILDPDDDEFAAFRARMDAVARAQSPGEQVPQIAFAREMFGRGEHRVMELAEFDLEVALIGHLERVPDRLRHLGEAGLHLLRRTQVELLFGVLHPPGVGKLGLGADADEAIVRVGIPLFDVMNVVRRNELQAELPGQRNQLPVHLRLLRQLMVLQFEIKILRSQRLFEPVNRPARLWQLVLQQAFRDLARQAARQRDQPVLVGRQEFLVDARLVVIALEMRRGGQADEVLVAGFVLRQEHEVVVDVAAARAGFFSKRLPGAT